MKRILETVAWMAVLAMCLVLPARAADHNDGLGCFPPCIANPNINDVYAFRSPANPDNSVLVLTVNPAERVSPTDTISGFGPDVSYQFLVDNNGDAAPDIIYSTTFTDHLAGSQTLSLTRIANSTSIPLAAGATDSNISIAGGGMIRAALHDDPFFVDAVGFHDGFHFTGVDAFAGANVAAIVLELPSADLGAQNVGVWARTVVDSQQVDRVGRPLINTLLIPSDMRDAFNSGTPSTDAANFSDEVMVSIAALSNTANAAALTPMLLPDMLTFDPPNGGGFLNGRRLDDDVIDAMLNLLSDGAVTGDGVNGNDVPFLAVFPYLAPPHPIPEPPITALLILALSAAGRSVRRPDSREYPGV